MHEHTHTHGRKRMRAYHHNLRAWARLCMDTYSEVKQGGWGSRRRYNFSRVVIPPSAENSDNTATIMTPKSIHGLASARHTRTRVDRTSNQGKGNGHFSRRAAHAAPRRRGRAAPRPRGRPHDSRAGSGHGTVSWICVETCMSSTTSVSVMMSLRERLRGAG
jgi:hypothetical protein